MSYELERQTIRDIIKASEYTARPKLASMRAVSRLAQRWLEEFDERRESKEEDQQDVKKSVG